jgi:hypothetical protein
MPLAVVEQIAQVIESRLLAMVGDAVAYPIDVLEVVRPTRLGEFTPSDRQIVLVQGPQEIVAELSYPGNPPATCFRQVYQIRCHIMGSERAAETIDSALNQFQNDIFKAIKSVGSTWHTFGGLAIDAQFLSPEYVAADGGIDGVNCPIAVTFRTDEDDLTQVRG